MAIQWPSSGQFRGVRVLDIAPRVWLEPRDAVAPRAGSRLCRAVLLALHPEYRHYSSSTLSPLRLCCPVSLCLLSKSFSCRLMSFRTTSFRT